MFKIWQWLLLVFLGGGCLFICLFFPIWLRHLKVFQSTSLPTSDCLRRRCWISKGLLSNLTHTSHCWGSEELLLVMLILSLLGGSKREETPYLRISKTTWNCRVSFWFYCPFAEGSAQEQSLSIVLLGLPTHWDGWQTPGLGVQMECQPCQGRWATAEAQIYVCGYVSVAQYTQSGAHSMPCDHDGCPCLNILATYQVTK